MAKAQAEERAYLETHEENVSLAKRDKINARLLLDMTTSLPPTMNSQGKPCTTVAENPIHDTEREGAIQQGELPSTLQAKVPEVDLQRDGSVQKLAGGDKETSSVDANHETAPNPIEQLLALMLPQPQLPTFDGYYLSELYSRL